jgi:hypothetical protein
VSKLVDDVTSGNFGDASDQVSTVSSSFQSLEQSVEGLSSAESELKDLASTIGDTLSC